MRLEVSNKHCPLCKRTVATGDHPDSSRLCQECRSLLHTIMPKAGSNSFAAADQAQAALQSSFAGNGRLSAPVAFDEGLSDTHFNSQEHRAEFASFSPVTDFEEVQVAPGVETEYFDDFQTNDDEPQVFLMAEPPKSFQNKAVPLEARSPDDASKLNLLQADAPVHLISLPRNIQAGEDAEKVSETNATAEQIAVDPWDDPLPTWEYSRNEYPLYLGVSTRKRIRRLRTLLVPATVLLFLVAAYLFFQLRTDEQHSKLRTEQVKVESALPVAPASDDAHKPDVEKAEPEKVEAEKASAISFKAIANEDAQTQWRHALQALASSSEDEANLFAAKLVRAGIPAYVVPADIERRGKWYRVRIGGFNTAQEAQKFVAEARLRAKAAGINLKDLNVVDYEKP